MRRWTSPCFLAVAFCSLSISVVVAAGKSPATFTVRGDTLEIRGGERSLRVSLKSPALVLDNADVAGGVSPSNVSGTLEGGGTIEVSYPLVSIGNSARLETKLFVRWSDEESLLRKWGRVRLVDAGRPRLLKEVVLDRVATAARPVWTHGERAEHRQVISSDQSQPIFAPGEFFGVEFPIASSRCDKNQIVLAHRPGAWLNPGEWYTTRIAVYGLTPVGGEVRAFRRYISMHRPTPHKIHIDYNSWWTSPAPYFTEKDILGLMRIFEEKLYKAHGAAFDSFCIDMGWSDPKSIWEIDAKNFPQKFSHLQAAAERMHSNLGLWISPSSRYPTAVNGTWAKTNGFETFRGDDHLNLCLAGRRYGNQFQKRLFELVDQHGIRQLKLDGYHVACPAADHGHEPGILSSEAVAAGAAAAMDAAHQANPSVWIETTCFGFNPSPWWLFHANSVIGAYGDDAPAGRVPSPIYRESYTTSRDFFNLQGASLLPIPIGAQEVLGIVHQSPDPFTNDAVATILRGHEFIPVYVNPKFMNDARWRDLAGLLKWARNNETTLRETVPLLPVAWQHGEIPRFTDKGVMPREPYGYAHVENSEGLVMLRNPWIVPQSYKFKLDESVGFTPNGPEKISVVGLYPEPRLYAERLKFGDTLNVALAPYETVVLSVGPHLQTSGITRASNAVRRYVTVGACKHRLQRAAAPKSKRPGQPAAETRLMCDAKVHAMAPQAELLMLCEYKKSPTAPVGQLTINGRKVHVETISSDAGWSATTLPRHENWVFLRASLPPGESAVALDYAVPDGCERISVWALAAKPGAASEYPNALPQPETIFLAAAALLETVDLSRERNSSESLGYFSP